MENNFQFLIYRSADGRLLMWKVTGKAIAGHPVTGTGLGGFPEAYAEMQGQYFGTEEATDKEKRVAGCPEYAFNEYLQIGLEQGIGGWIVFVSWLGSMMYYGIRNRQHGAVGLDREVRMESYPIRFLTARQERTEVVTRAGLVFSI